MHLVALLIAVACAQSPSPGLTLFAPTNDTTTYLVDEAGVVVQTWPSGRLPSFMVRLLDSGNLLRQTRLPLPGSSPPTTGLDEIEFDGTVVWSWAFVALNEFGHHDMLALPDGNVLMLARELLTAEDAIAMGRDPTRIPEEVFFTDQVIEIQKTGPTSGSIVWKWRAWDHLVQDFDPTKDGYDVVGDRPGRLDINYPPTPLVNGDWLHTNGIDHHAGLDQIVISARLFDEVWVLDHSTTTAEAATSSGGRQDRGGDLLYRWGNPAAYRAGETSDAQLFGQHDPTWIEDGRPGGGNLLVFNNGNFRPGGNYSSVEEIVTPVDASGSYPLVPGTSYGPAAPVWSYMATPPSSFFSSALSGAERLANGNTLITDGLGGRVFEVDSAGVEVWQYQNPFPVGQPTSMFKARRHERYLWADTETLSAASPATVDFDLVAGSSHAGVGYLLLASLSGTVPGTPLPGGSTLPLNYDSLSFAVLNTLNSPCFSNFGGTLDSLGNGSAQLVVPNPPGAALVGRTICFAYVLVPSFVFVSDPRSLEVVP